MPSTLKDVRDTFARADGDGFTKESFTKTFGEYLLIGKYLDPLEWTTGDPKIPQINMLEGKLRSIEKTVCTGLLATDDGPFNDAAAYWAKHGSALVETVGGQIKIGGGATEYTPSKMDKHQYVGTKLTTAEMDKAKVRSNRP